MAPPTMDLDYPETGAIEDQGDWSEARPLKEVLRTKTVRFTRAVQPLRHSRRPRSQAAFLNKLAKMEKLSQGWDGYQAPPPALYALSLAGSFLHAMFRADFFPDRVAPSVIGGVGFTLQHDEREAYVEIANSGSVHVVFSHGDAEPIIRSVGESGRDLSNLIAEMRDYLDA